MSDYNKRVCSIGDRASLTKEFTQRDLEVFAAITMDDNGIHTDAELAKMGLFRRPVIHGVLVASLISSVMGTKLPGHGTILREQNIEYINPVYPGDVISAEVTITGIEEHNKYYIATLQGRCTNQDGIVVTEATCKQLMLKRLFEVK